MGGVYWQYPADNWGQKPGYAIVSASKVTFWAAGKKGDEIVEFKAGGIVGNKYRDSFEISTGRIKLSKTWNKYAMSLEGKDLTNVSGAFAWVVSGDANPEGLIFYLDDIRYE